MNFKWVRAGIYQVFRFVTSNFAFFQLFEHKKKDKFNLKIEQTIFSTFVFAAFSEFIPHQFAFLNLKLITLHLLNLYLIENFASYELHFIALNLLILEVIIL